MESLMPKLALCFFFSYNGQIFSYEDNYSCQLNIAIFVLQYLDISHAMDKYLSTKTITLAGTMRRINLPPMRCITPPPMVEARLTSPLSPPTFPLWLILAPAAVFYYSHPVITLAQMPANISPPQPNQQKSPLPDKDTQQSCIQSMAIDLVPVDTVQILVVLSLCKNCILVLYVLVLVKINVTFW